MLGTQEWIGAVVALLVKEGCSSPNIVALQLYNDMMTEILKDISLLDPITYVEEYLEDKKTDES